MQVIHITPETNGYEIVELLANRYSKTNSLAVIEKDGTKFITGGIILNNSEQIKSILDSIPRDKQYKFAFDFISTPFVKSYFED